MAFPGAPKDGASPVGLTGRPYPLPAREGTQQEIGNSIDGIRGLPRGRRHRLPALSPFKRDSDLIRRIRDEVSSLASGFTSRAGILLRVARREYGEYAFTGLKKGMEKLAEWSSGEEARDMFEREEAERRKFIKI